MEAKHTKPDIYNDCQTTMQWSTESRENPQSRTVLGFSIYKTAR